MEPKGSLPHSKQSTTRPRPHVSIQSTASHTSFKIYINIILPSMPRFPKRPLSLRFPHQNLVRVSLFPMRATCPAHLIFLDMINQTLFGERSISLYVSFSLLSPRPSETQIPSSTPCPPTRMATSCTVEGSKPD